jgi:4-hydroxy-3-methylbut-2-enyl diphosphate reductase
VFVEEVAQVPEGATLLFSAHGVSPDIRQNADRRHLRTIDATCPLVIKVHREAIRFSREGYSIVLVGHEGHDEVVGTMGEAPHAMHLVETEEDVDRLELPAGVKIACLTQTTLSVDDADRIVRRLKIRFPQLVAPSRGDICYATQNRQEAVRALSPEVDVVIVLGSQNSSNSRRLQELAAQCGVPAYLVDSVTDLHPDWLRNNHTVLVTAGASAPESVVRQCVDHLRNRYNATVEIRSICDEQVHFPLPRGLPAAQL